MSDQDFEATFRKIRDRAATKPKKVQLVDRMERLKRRHSRLVPGYTYSVAQLSRLWGITPESANMYCRAHPRHFRVWTKDRQVHVRKR